MTCVSVTGFSIMRTHISLNTTTCRTRTPSHTVGQWKKVTAVTFFRCPTMSQTLPWNSHPRMPRNSTSATQVDCAWWRHQMETFSALLTICAGNSPVPGEFPTQRPVTRSFDVFFDLRLNKRLRKQSWGWWFETLPCPLWRHSNGTVMGSFKAN